MLDQSLFLSRPFEIVCTEGGYLSHQGYDIASMRAPIQNIASLLASFRQHTYPIFHTREGHRPDLSSLLPRELARSRNNHSGSGIGDAGPMGRLLIRGEPGHNIIPELYPLEGEPIIDKPGKSAFGYTDFELLLKVKGIKNLIICGVTEEVCVGSTVREATERGYDCLVVKDAVGASEKGGLGVEGLAIEGGIFGAWVAEAREVVEAITKAAGDDV